MKKFFAAVLAVCLSISVFPFFNPSVLAGVQPEITAKSAILIDAVSGEVLYEKNPHEKLPPASVTKVMTMLMVMEAIDAGQITFGDTVTINEEAANMGGTQLFLEVGETRTVEELMYGVAVESGNDAATALGVKLGGSVTGFVEKMNARAKELGMDDTHFEDACGLTAENHYTSAYDIALMSRELISHPDIFKFLTTWMIDVNVGKNNDKLRTLANTNKLLRQRDYIDGIKTGYTAEAGHCISATGKSGDLRLISVIMHGTDSKTRFEEADALLQYGFSQYQAVFPVKSGDTVGELHLYNAQKESIPLIVKENVYQLMKKDAAANIEKELILEEEYRYAPVAADEKVGELVVKSGETEIARMEVFTAEQADKISFSQYLKFIKKYLLP